jgi:hypothetical protein
MTASAPDFSTIAKAIGLSEQDFKSALFAGLYEALPKEAAKILVHLADTAESEGKKSIPVKRLRDMALKLAILDRDEYMGIMEKTVL